MSQVYVVTKGKCKVIRSRELEEPGGEDMSDKIHIICVECGHSIELDGEVYADYNGPV